MIKNPTSIQTRNFNTDFFSIHSWTLLYFWAQWSGACRLLSLFVDNAAKTYGDRLQVFKIDADQHPDLARHYQVETIPTLLLLRQGQVVDTVEGVLSRPQLEQMLKPHLVLESPSDRLKA
jgi:thioredoxin 1